MVNAFAQLVATSLAVGVMVGSGVTRISRRVLTGRSPSSVPARSDPAAPLPKPPPAELPLQHPAPVPSRTEGVDAAGFYIVEEASGMFRSETYNFGACHSSQKNSLDAEGFIFEGDENSEPEHKYHRGCAVEGLNGTMVVLTPMHNRAHVSKGEMASDRYFRLLATLTYPRALTSIAILVGDSTDDTYAEALRNLEGLKGKGYRRLMLLSKDFGAAAVPAEERHKYKHQLARRIHLARVRNWLAVTALRDEEWALWLDADLWSYPPDLVQQLMEPAKDFIVPHCVTGEEPGAGTFDFNSWQETEASLNLQDTLEGDDVLFEGYAGRPTHRKHMDALRQEGKRVVKLDGVGGAAILIRTALHREGVLFPTFPFNHAVETEGLAKAALAMGYQPYGMPLLHVVHK